jgi:hypothetical protein
VAKLQGEAWKCPKGATWLSYRVMRDQVVERGVATFFNATDCSTAVLD